MGINHSNTHYASHYIRIISALLEEVKNLRTVSVGESKRATGGKLVS